MQQVQSGNEPCDPETVIVGVDVGGTKIAAGIVDAQVHVLATIVHGMLTYRSQDFRA